MIIPENGKLFVDNTRFSDKNKTVLTSVSDVRCFSAHSDIKANPFSLNTMNWKTTKQRRKTYVYV